MANTEPVAARTSVAAAERLERALPAVTLTGEHQKWVRAGLALAALAVYVMAYLPPYNFRESGVIELIAMPVLVAAWLFGFWAGLLAALASIPVNTLLLNAVGQPGWELIKASGSLNGSVLVLVLGAVRGLRDLGQQLQAELAMRKGIQAQRDQSEERYRIVAESASDAIFTLDEGGRILFANRAAREIFGFDSSELEGRPFTVLLPEEERRDRRAALTLYFDELSESASRDALELRGVSRDGREIDLEISFGRQQEGERYFFSAVVRDVTERKQVQQSLQQAKEEAERANRAKSEFLSRMSHELRTPLNAILGFGQLLEMEEIESEEQRDSVDQIMKAGRHLLALVDEVLDIARIEAGRLALTPESVDVAEVLNEAWDLVRPRAVQRRIQRVGQVLSCTRWVYADRQRLKQVVLNLMSNALKFTPDGSAVTVSCAQPREGYLRILIADSGPGIAQDKLDRLFRPFERLDAEQTGIEGTGIGLALSKALIEAMDGAIGVLTEEGKGATFWVELPLDAFAGAVDVPDGESPSEWEESDLRTILYIEDSPSSFELVKRILTREPSYRLLSAAIQGGLGLELAAEHVPDLILLDLNLPDMPAEEVLRRLRKDPHVAHVPVIVITANAADRRRDRLIAAGADGYLSKPLDVEQFLRTIEEVVTARSS
jgi:PAS domain S-box-containing protein